MKLGSEGIYRLSFFLLIEENCWKYIGKINLDKEDKWYSYWEGIYCYVGGFFIVIVRKVDKEYEVNFS